MIVILLLMDTNICILKPKYSSTEQHMKYTHIHVHTHFGIKLGDSLSLLFILHTDTNKQCQSEFTGAHSFPSYVICFLAERRSSSGSHAL